jgi:hypothetical protein
MGPVGSPPMFRRIGLPTDMGIGAGKNRGAGHGLMTNPGDSPQVTMGAGFMRVIAGGHGDPVDPSPDPTTLLHWLLSLERADPPQTALSAGFPWLPTRYTDRPIGPRMCTSET